MAYEPQAPRPRKLYILLDANVTAGYYLSRSLRSPKARELIANIFDAARSGQAEFFFYLPNFCVAEVFSVFMKHSFGSWNNHVKRTIDTRVYHQLVKQFQDDIHNGKFIYPYELSRYHVLGISLVAPVDHYFRFYRGTKRTVVPMGTFDHLIISMGINLAHIHGRDNVIVVSTDDRLLKILGKCRTTIPKRTIERLKLDEAQKLTGRLFHPDTFPDGVNLKTATQRQLKRAFGVWPLPIGHVPAVYRWKRTN